MSLKHPLSILQVITQRRFSGAERICISLCEELQNRGHRVTLLCKENGTMPAIAAEYGVAARVPSISGKLNLTAPFRISAIAREVKADIIHTHLSTAGLWGSIAGKMAGIPTVAHVHAMNSKQCYTRADRIVTCSQGVMAHLVSQGVDAGRIRVAYNGIDLRRFESLANPVELRRSLAIPPEAPVIGCVAHLSPKKGQEFLVRAVALLTDRFPDLHCILVGEGDQAALLNSLAVSLGIGSRVHLTGFRNDAVSVINLMDILVLPSVAKEGLGLALVEAAILGKPTIASNAPGIDEALVDGTTGYLVPPGSPRELADKIALLLPDSELRMRLGSAGRTFALHTFTIPAMTGRIEEVYAELLAEGSAR